ncbi:MAG: ribonuclease P protein component [Acuticoccus sp.]
MERLKRRAAFRHAARGIRVGREEFTLQAVARDDAAAAPRIGFTVTKKVGNAVVRNRIRRRLRALCDEEAGAFASGNDYVIVARRAALTAPFAELRAELCGALHVARKKLERGTHERENGR